jgi:hypothetical protein
MVINKIATNIVANLEFNHINCKHWDGIDKISLVSVKQLKCDIMTLHTNNDFMIRFP